MSLKSCMINGEVIFDVNSGELKSLSPPGESSVLNAPTARCLQLLIEKDGSVVSRDDFMEQVWLARGIVVSQNTFYQNISLLRKSLKMAGLTKDIVTTVRRKGFTLTSGTLIQPVHDEVLVNEDIEQGIQDGSLEANSVAVATINEIPVKPSQTKLKWVIALLVVVVILELTSLVAHTLE